MNPQEVKESVRRGHHLWQPHIQNKPQQLAYLHPADELLYGGSAGGGKTDLIIGVACTLHKQSIIYRRTYKQLKAVKRRTREILRGSGAQENKAEGMWHSMPGDRMLDFGAVQYENDVWNFQGQPHDLVCFDELTQFTQFQYDTLLGWLRTTEPGQRTRVIGATNPPPRSEGWWVLKYWAPWLDKRHPNPAVWGELRWFVQIEGESNEVAGPEPVLIDGETVYPTSRSFIPARITDNIYLLHDNAYMARLQGLPEPLRSQLLMGDWFAGQEDAEWQVIPTDWILAAIERWKERVARRDIPDFMHCAGIDVARGGTNQTVIARRYGNFLGKLIKRKGAKTPDGQSVRRLARKFVPSTTMVNIDVIGIGSSGYDFIKEEWKFVRGVEASGKSFMRDRTGKYEMANVRAEQWWNMREKLDPEFGDDICLPDDPELISDLTAPTYEVRSGKIHVVEKKKLVKELGRSPDCGDACCLAFLRGNKLAFDQYLRSKMEEE